MSETETREPGIAEQLDKWAELAYTLVALGFLSWQWYHMTGNVVPMKTRITYYMSRVAEKTTGALWDTTLDLRAQYRRDVSVV